MSRYHQYWHARAVCLRFFHTICFFHLLVPSVVSQTIFCLTLLALFFRDVTLNNNGLHFNFPFHRQPQAPNFYPTCRRRSWETPIPFVQMPSSYTYSLALTQVIGGFSVALEDGPKFKQRLSLINVGTLAFLQILFFKTNISSTFMTITIFKLINLLFQLACTVGFCIWVGTKS